MSTSTTAKRPAVRKPKEAAPLYTVNKQWFLDQMADHQINSTHVAKVMGIDKSALSLVLSGKRRLKNEEAASLALHLGVSLADVLANAGVDLRGVARPAISVPLPTGLVVKIELPGGISTKDWEIASSHVAQLVAARNEKS